MEHKLKILSRYYEAILQGKKTFEVRKDDRPFNEGDTLVLQEIVTPNGLGYTGREMEVDVTYILRDSEYVKGGYCIMGIKIKSTNEARHYGNKPSRRAKCAADVQPAKRGEWEKKSSVGVFRCSLCQHIFMLGADEIDEYHFCPNCGARMDGDTNG